MDKEPSGDMHALTVFFGEEREMHDLVQNDFVMSLKDNCS